MRSAVKIWRRFLHQMINVHYGYYTLSIIHSRERYGDFKILGKISLPLAVSLWGSPLLLCSVGILCSNVMTRWRRTAAALDIGIFWFWTVQNMAFFFFPNNEATDLGYMSRLCPIFPFHTPCGCWLWNLLGDAKALCCSGKNMIVTLNCIWGFAPFLDPESSCLVIP